MVNIARGSLAELETQIIIARRLDFISAPAFEKTTGEMAIIGRMLTNLTRTLQRK